MKSSKSSINNVDTLLDQLDMLFDNDQEDLENDLIDLDQSSNSTYLDDIRTGRVKNFDQITECPHCGTATPINIDPQGKQSFHCRECGMNI